VKEKTSATGKSKADRSRREALKALGDGRVEVAIDCMQKALQWAPNDPELHCDLGQIYFETGRYEDAEASFKSALKQHYDHKRALKGAGFAVQELGKQTEAVYFYLRYLKEHGEDSDVLLNTGAALHDLGKYEDALEYYKKAKTYDSNNSMVFENQAGSLYSLGRIDEAIAALRNAIDLDPTNKDVCKLMGLCLESKGLREDALEWYLKALNEEVPDGDLRLQISELLVLDSFGRYAEACEQAKLACDIFEGTKDRAGMTRAYWDLGWAYYRLQQFGKSIEASQRAVELSPDHYQVRFNLALALLIEGRQEDAKSEYLRAADGLESPDLQYWGIDDLEEALERRPDLPGGHEVLKILKEKSLALIRVRPSREEKGDKA
jgi:protein O-GlcNAc transferase